MKRTKIFGIVSILLILLVSGVSVLAQNGINGSGWWTAIQVQRTGSIAGDATVTMNAYAPQGDSSGPWDCGSRVLSAFGKAAAFYPFWDTDPSGDNCADDLSFPSSYQGSSVLSSTDETVAVVQLQNISYGGWAPGDTPYGRAVGTYEGTSSPSEKLVFPLYKNDHNGEITTFFIQNTGSSPANILATFRPCSDNGQGSPCLGYGNTYTYEFTGIDQNKMIVIDATLAKDSGDNPLPAGTYSFGGLTIESTNSQNLAGVVVEHHKDASPAMYVKAYRGFAAEGVNVDTGSTLYTPVVKYQYPDGVSAVHTNKAKWTGLIVHNADTSALDITITYTLAQRNGDPTHPDVGTQYTKTITALNPGESAFELFHNALNPVSGTQPRDLLAAKIDVVGGSGKIVAIAQEEGTWTAAGDKDYATYSALADNKKATQISVPMYKEQYKKGFNGVVVQNTSSTAATVTATIHVLNAEHTGVSTDDEIKIQATAPGNGSVVIYMVCRDYQSQYTDLGGDDANMADLCSPSAPANPTAGSNAGMIIESTQPVIVYANEELLWFEDPSGAGDGHGMDASSYVGFPINP